MQDIAKLKQQIINQKRQKAQEKLAEKNRFKQSPMKTENSQKKEIQNEESVNKSQKDKGKKGKREDRES